MCPFDFFVHRVVFRRGLVRISYPLEWMQGCSRRGVLSWGGIQRSRRFRSRVPYFLVAFVSSMRAVSFQHMNVGRLRFPEFLHAVRVQDAILGGTELLLRGLCALLKMVLAQHRILHPHHISI